MEIRMDKKSLEDGNILKKLTGRYIIAFVFIFCVIIARQLIMQTIINHDTHSSTLVNVSGRQRMLSQQISKDAYALYLYEDNSIVKEHLKELKNSTDLFEYTQIHLQSGEINDKYSYQNSDTINRLFSEVESNYKAILDASKQMIMVIESDNYTKEDLSEYLTIIQENEPKFLDKMESIVNRYDKEIVEKNRSLFRIELILFVVLVLSILSQIVIIFVPGLKKLSESYRNILYFSYHDRLTGLFNRYYFDVKVTDVIECSDKSHVADSMIIMDLDHFKKVNDTWGHPIGDEVLLMSAKIAESSIRETDVLARLGGEEFIILLPKTGIDEAVIVAEKIRVAVETSLHPVAGKITCSLGVVERKEQESYSKWYKRVDEALYRAKEEGRNRVVRGEADEQFVEPQFEWSKDWECGQQELDKQHRYLLENGIRLVHATIAMKDQVGLKNDITQILDYLLDHFECEETYLEKIEYPDLMKHKAMHAKLKEKVIQMKSAYLKDQIKATTIISYLVNDIIIGHLREEDRNFFTYIKNHLL
jgi:diguanylate cyclase (GGDEF)-like protein/hemerythrin-like metal-binding protein